MPTGITTLTDYAFGSAQRRMYQALSGQKPDRVPTLPKIWLNLAAKIQRVAIEDVAGSPARAMRTIVDAALAVNADGVRLFQFPPRRLERQGDQVMEVDAQGVALGPIDLAGGLATHVADPKSVSDPTAVAFAQFWSSPVPVLQDLALASQMVIPPAAFFECHFGAIQRGIVREFGSRIALIGDCGPIALAFHVGLRGMQTGLMDLLDNPSGVQRVTEIASEIAIQKGKFNIDCGLRLLRLNDSVGNMSVVSPTIWRQFVKPGFKRVCDALHAYCPDIRIYCHICGNTLPVMEDLVETGLDGIGPMDPMGGFTCAQARQIVGKRAALVGGVSTLAFVRGTPDDIRTQTAQCIQDAGLEGGFVVGSGCALPSDTRIENLHALAAAAGSFACPA